MKRKRRAEEKEGREGEDIQVQHEGQTAEAGRDGSAEVVVCHCAEKVN